MSTKDNLNLNVNPAREDKFSLVFGSIPSLPLLTPEDLENYQKLKVAVDEQNYFDMALKSIEMPGLAMDEMTISTMFVDAKDVTNKFQFENLTTVVRLDNNFLIYKILVLWMFLINRPDEFNQFSSQDTYEKTTVTSILTMRDNFNTPVISFEFYGLRPISIGGLPLSYESDGKELSLNVTWQYTYFMPRKQNGEIYPLNLT